MTYQREPADVALVLSALLGRHLPPEAAAFLQEAGNEIRQGMTDARFAQLFALASRKVRSSVELLPEQDELETANRAVAGWNPARWSLLDALRIAILFECPVLEGDGFAARYETCFRFADHAELCALYRALPLLPQGERFLWRAGEGCRSNMRSVFEAVACDSPYAARHFDDVGWRQLIVKGLFLDVPLWRVTGLDGRLSPELARMALDFAEERRSAGRAVPPQLWLCLGKHAGERGMQALKQELAAGTPIGQRAALLALARAGELNNVQRSMGSALTEHMPLMTQIANGEVTQSAFASLLQAEPEHA